MPVSTSHLARGYSVQALMVPTKDLRRASRIETARPLFDDFDVVPYPASGRISGFFHKSSSKVQDLTPEALISSDTPILDLPGLLSVKQFYFVNQGNRVVGYVHYSDFNRSPSRTPFFALLEAAETSLLSRIRDRVSEEDIRSITTRAQFAQIRKWLLRRTVNNLDVGWVGVLDFGEILQLSRLYHLITLDNKDIELLVQFRNKIAHSNLDMIEGYPEIRQLSKAKNLLQAMAKSA